MPVHQVKEERREFEGRISAFIDFWTALSEGLNGRFHVTLFGMFAELWSLELV